MDKLIIRQLKECILLPLSLQERAMTRAATSGWSRTARVEVGSFSQGREWCRKDNKVQVSHWSN
jgi:hypothetical protein